MTIKADDANPAAEALIALQNRINDLAVSLQTAEEERKGAKGITAETLDAKLIEIRGEIDEAKKEFRAVKLTSKDEGQGDDTDGTEGISFDKDIDAGLESLNALA